VSKKAVLFIGIPASGKTSYYRRYFSADYVHINLDTLRTRKKELLKISYCLENSLNFVVDNTNPTKSERARYISLAKAAGYQVDGYFFQSIVNDCIERNSQREGEEQIPSKAIAAISNKLELPSFDEGYDNLYFVKIAESGFITQSRRCGDEV
jgi:predicted kinase